MGNKDNKVVIEYYDLTVTISKVVSKATYYPIDSATPEESDDFDEILDYYEYEIDLPEYADTVLDIIRDYNSEIDYSDEELDKIYLDIINRPDDYMEEYFDEIHEYFEQSASEEASEEYSYSDYFD